MPKDFFARFETPLQLQLGRKVTAPKPVHVAVDLASGPDDAVAWVHDSRTQETDQQHPAAGRAGLDGSPPRYEFVPFHQFARRAGKSNLNQHLRELADAMTLASPPPVRKLWPTAKMWPDEAADIKPQAWEHLPSRLCQNHLEQSLFALMNAHPKKT